MYKNMFKRAGLSVRRKLTRSTIIALVFFIISNLILAAIIIKTAVNESTEYAKSSLGGTVSIQADMTNLRADLDNAEPQSPTSQNGQNDAKRGKMFARPAVSRSVADQIASSSYVKDYSYSLATAADSTSLTAVENDTNEPGGKGDMFGGPEHLNMTSAGDFTISGINAYAYIDGVGNGQIELASGDYFNETDENIIIISTELAETNNLAVGDTVKLVHTDTNKTYKLTIGGIYENSSNFFDANTIYTNIDTAANFLDEETYNDGDFTVDDVQFIMNDAGEAAEFISWIEESFPELAENHLVAKEDTALYDQMVGPIESVGSFASLVLWGVIIAGVVIISLIIITDVKDRRYEMGVLLSLGAKKASIIGQIFLELLLVSTVAFIISCGTATALAHVMGQGILDAQLASATTEAENNFGRPTNGSGGHGGNGKFNENIDASADTNNAADANPPDFDNNFSHQQAITEIDINARPIDFLLLFVLGYGIIIFVLLCPAVNILRYQPKQILQGKE